MVLSISCPYMLSLTPLFSLPFPVDSPIPYPMSVCPWVRVCVCVCVGGILSIHNYLFDFPFVGRPTVP